MKLITIFIALFIFSKSAMALTYRFQCVGNRGGVSVSLYTSKDQKRLFMNYNNSLGAKDFPFYEGTVTKLSLPYINIAAKELSSIDYQALLSWPVENCTFNKEKPLLVECNGAATFLIPENTTLESYTLITSTIKEESLTSKYDIFKIRWGIEGEEYHHSIAMPFDPKFCQAEYLP